MNQGQSTAPHSYGFGPLVEECARRGISKTVAFDLVKRGLLETFPIGRRRYVRIASLESLPDRMGDGTAERQQ